MGHRAQADTFSLLRHFRPEFGMSSAEIRRSKATVCLTGCAEDAFVFHPGISAADYNLEDIWPNAQPLHCSG